MEIISPWFLYLWTRLDPLLGLFVGMNISAGMIAIITFMVWGLAMEMDEKYKPATFRVWKWCAGAVILATLGLTFVPSKKDAAIIYVIPAIANNAEIQAEMKDFYDFGKAALKEYLPVPEEEAEK